MKKQSLITLLTILSFLLSAASCDGKPTADDKMRRQTEMAMQEANRQVGMPAITNFQERKLAKMIFELRDQADLICYAYIVNKMTGKLVFLGKSIGFGLPYSVQFTNPERIAYRNRGTGVATLPQADPNGLFMPTGLSATWLMLINPKTKKPQPVYIEPEIVVSPFPLH